MWKYFIYFCAGMHLAGALLALLMIIRVITFYRKEIKGYRSLETCALLALPLFLFLFSWFSVARIVDMWQDIDRIKELERFAKADKNKSTK